jgi:magnesium transporter
MRATPPSAEIDDPPASTARQQPRLVDRPRRGIHAESALSHVAARVPTARGDDAIETCLSRLSRERFDAADVIYVVDDQGALLGAVSLTDMLAAPSRKAPVSQLTDRSYPRVDIGLDREDAASAAIERGTTSVALIDASGAFQGAVVARTLLDILRREHVEDLHRLAGIRHEDDRTRDAIEEPPLRRVRHRLPWLLLGLAGSLGTAGIVSRFEHLLQRKTAVMFFVPAIVYLADAVGTQTEAVTVRGLSLSRLSLGQLLGGELTTGALIGATLGALALPVVVVAFGDVRLAVSVAAAIWAASSVATTVGLLLPWVLQRLHTDPAFGSGPIATIVQDVLSLLMYFVISTVLLG